MSMSVVLLNRDVHVCDQSVALGVLVGAPTSAPDGKQRCWSKGFVNFEGGEMPSGGGVLSSLQYFCGRILK